MKDGDEALGSNLIQEVTTESGHKYLITELFSIGKMWRATQARSHDREGIAGGVVASGPVMGQPMRLYWIHPERGTQLRLTTPVIFIKRAEVTESDESGERADAAATTD